MKILIAGGGIAGLTLAHSLNKVGLESMVYERSSELAELGAGIWLQPNAMKVMDHLGLGDAIRAEGARLLRAEITDSQLRPFRKVEAGLIHDEKGNGIVSIHRARLQRILFEHMPKGQVKWGSGYLHHEQSEGGALKVTVGEDKVEADLLLGADGIHSRVRAEIFPQSSTRSSGQVCWRGISKYRLPRQMDRVGREAWHRGLRFGFASISEDEVYWFAVAKGKTADYPEVPGREDLATRYAAYHPVVGDLIRHTPEHGILQHDLLELKRLSAWHHGPVCLLGDAAHAMTPNMGQGAGQSIEDAYYLAKALANNPDSSAFATFEAKRRSKVDGIVKNSWRFGQMAHHPIGRGLMRTMMRWVPMRVMEKQMEELFAVEGL